MEAVYQQYYDKPFSKEELADIIKQKPKSGGFVQKIADFQKYGLISRCPDGQFTLTKLAINIFKGNTKDNIKLFENVELWKLIFEKFNTNIKQEDFWKHLQTIAKTDEIEAQKKADVIFDAYFKDIQYIQKHTKTDIDQERQHHLVKKSNSHSQKEEVIQLPTKTPVIIHKALSITRWELYLLSDKGEYYLEVFDEITYNLAVELLKSIRKELEKDGVSFCNSP